MPVLKVFGCGVNRFTMIRIISISFLWILKV